MSCGCNKGKEQPRGGDLDLWTPPTVDGSIMGFPSWIFMLALVLIGVFAYRKLAS